MTGPDAIAIARHQQERQFNVAGADLLEEIYGHLSAVRSELIADRIDAEHIATARELVRIAWRAQRSLNDNNQDQYGATLDAVRGIVGSDQHV